MAKVKKSLMIRISTYLDGLQAKVNELRELQSASGEELSTLMPSILDKVFTGELLGEASDQN